MSENERLGIELYVIPPKGDTGTSFLKTLQESIDKISKALSAVDLSPLAKGVDKTTSSGKKGVDDFAKSISSLNNELSKTSRSSFKMDGLTEAAKAVASINTSTTSAIAAGLKLASTWEEFRKINAAVAKEMAGGVNSKASQILGAAWQNTKDPVTGVPDATKLEAVNKLLGKIGDSAGKSAIEVKTLLKDLKEMKLNDTVLIGIRKMEQPQDAHVVAKDKFSAGVASETDLASLSRQKELQAQILAESKKEAELRAAYRQAEKQGVADSVKNYQMELGFATQRKEKLIEEARVLAAKVKDEKQAWQDRLVGEKAVEQAISARTKAEIKANADVQASAEKANTARMQIYTDSRRNVQAESKASALMANPSTANPQLGVAINAVSLAKEAGDVDKLKTAYGLLRAEVSNTNAVASANPWKNIFAGMEVGKTTLEQLTAKVREYKTQYGSVDDKALSSMSTALGHHKAKWDAATQSVVSNKKEVSAWTKLFGESIGQMATRLTEFYSIRTVIFAVGSEFRTAATTLMDFNQALHDTAAIANASPEALKRMEDSAISMAKNTKYSAVEVMEAMKLLAQAGVSDGDLPEVTRVATMLATGTGATFDQATKVLTTGMNVWNIAGEKSIYVANTLTAALNASKLEIGELSTAFNYLANQNALFGKSIEETTALIAVLRNQGMEASTIGTSMRQFMKTLVAPTPKFDNLLKTYGISREQVDPTKHSMVEILKIFEKVGEKGIAVQDIFQSLETRVGGGFATLFKAGSAELELMETRIKNSDAALIAYTESMKGFRAQVNVLRQEFVETMNAFVTKSGSETFLSGLTKDVQSLLVGLRGLAKEWNGFKTAGIGAIAAITALWNLTPWGRMITLGVGAATWAIKKQGDQVMGPARGVDTLTKEYADTSAKQARQGSDASDLLKIMKGKDLTAERFTKLSSEEKKRVNEILNANDSIFKGLSAQDLKYGDIQRRVSTLNETHTQSTKTFIANTNEQVRRLQILDKELETKKKMAQSAKPMFAEGIQRRIDELEAQRKPLVDSIAQAQSAIAGKTKFTDVGNGLKTGEYDPYSPPAVDVNTDSKIRKKDKGAEAAAKKVHNASLSFDLAMEEETVKQSKLKLDEIMQMVKDKSLTSKEIAQKELEVQAELTKLYGADGQSGLLGKAIKAKINKDLDSEGYTGTQREQLYAKRLNTELAQSKKDQAKYYTEFANYYKKQSDAFNAEVAKIKENAAKVQEANDKRTLELTFKNMEGNAEDRIDAYYTYLFSVYDRNELEFQKSKKALDEKFAADDSRDEAAYNESLDKLKAIKKDSNSKAQTETSSFVMSAMDSQIAKKEKEYATELRHAQAALTLKKQQVWSADEVRQLDIQAAQAEEETLIKKQKVYATELETIEGLKQRKTLGEKLSAADEAIVAKADDYKDKLADINAQLAAQKVKVQEISDLSFSGNFLQGMRSSLQSMGDFASMTKDLGKSLTDSFTNGLSSTVSNTFTTLFNPDTQKINELNQKIAELRTQKTTLESDIATIEANTSKTPEEIKNLNDKKIALDQVNSSLAQQEAAVRKQKDAWASFAEGLKGIMKTILQELQNYIIKLLVVWAVQKLVGLVGGMFGGSEQPTSNTNVINASSLDIVNQQSVVPQSIFAKGGIVKGYADGGLINGISGGLIPMSMGTPGKDSVPIMAMPGEIVIKKSSVDYYGADKLLALNDKKLAKFADGGMIGSSSSPAPSSTDGAKNWTLQIVNIAQGDQVPDPGQQASQIINVINSDIARKGPTYKTIKTAVAS